MASRGLYPILISSLLLTACTGGAHSASSTAKPAAAPADIKTTSLPAAVTNLVSASGNPIVPATAASVASDGYREDLDPCSAKYSPEIWQTAFSRWQLGQITWDPNVRPNLQNGDLPLNCAIKNQQMVTFVGLLSTKGVDVNLAGNAGKTPLMIALELDKPEYVEMLLRIPSLNPNLLRSTGSPYLVSPTTVKGEEPVKIKSVSGLKFLFADPRFNLKLLTDPTYGVATSEMNDYDFEEGTVDYDHFRSYMEYDHFKKFGDRYTAMQLMLEANMHAVMNFVFKKLPVDLEAPLYELPIGNDYRQKRDYTFTENCVNHWPDSYGRHYASDVEQSDDSEVYGTCRAAFMKNPNQKIRLDRIGAHYRYMAFIIVSAYDWELFETYSKIFPYPDFIEQACTDISVLKGHYTGYYINEDGSDALGTKQTDVYGLIDYLSHPNGAAGVCHRD